MLDDALRLDPDQEVRYYVDQDHSDLSYKQIGVPGFDFVTIRDILYNETGNNECACKDVVGMKLKDRHDIYDDDVMRALAAIDPIWLHAGYVILPNEEKSDWEKYAYRLTDEDIACNRAVDSVFESMVELSRLEWKRAIFYLAQAGWIVTERDLHYILVWDWS
jgi:hypothetical protein